MLKCLKQLKHPKGFIATLMAVVGFITAGIVLFVLSAIHQVDSRMEQLKSSRASQFFASYPSLAVGQIFSLTVLKNLLEDQGYHAVKAQDDLTAGTFVLEGSKEAPILFLHRAPFNGPGKKMEHLRAKLTFEPAGLDWKIQSISRLNTNEAIENIEAPPKKISAFYAGRIRTQSPVNLSDIPVSMREAVMAIEDTHFLEHRGISFKSILRALWKDIRAGKKAEGGSTITQQLMKNLYFNRKKSWIRKIREAVFAIVTEIRHSKEEILEAYLNEVYLGQWATQEIHGVSEGARFYFNQAISEISLSQAATLAALVQSPNTYDPHKDPAPLTKRRNLVLRRMLDAEFIIKDEYEFALNEPLGIVPSNRVLEDISYYMELVMKSLPDQLKERLDTDALTIYTSLNPYMQTVAAKALRENVSRLQSQFPALKKRAARGIHLQSALITIHVPSCSVIALQGGTSYRQTQFNRILQGKRQPGSLFKPFVYLAGLTYPSPNTPITPLTELDGTQFEWKYDNQTWKPKNYEKEYSEKVTARKALENSLNVPTAHLAQDVGISKIVDLISASGVKTPLPSVPSISLGSAEITPYELAESYTTLANLGKACSLNSVLTVFDENNNVVFENNPTFQEKLPLIPTFQTVQMLKGVFERGTARGAKNQGVQTQYFAGKTGTTNDYKDAWFVGFSPQILSLVWIGYDEEEKVGITGAAAALPLWNDFMKSAQSFVSLSDFQTPEGLKAVEIDPESSRPATTRCPSRYIEYFVPGTEPQMNCSLH